MLCLHRYSEQAIYIETSQGRVTVKVGRIDCGGRRVQLLIDAPKDIRITRDDAKVTEPKERPNAPLENDSDD